MAPDSKRMTAISIIGGGVATIAIVLLMIIIGSHFNPHKAHAQVLAGQQVERNSICFLVASINQPDTGFSREFGVNSMVTLYVIDDGSQMPLTLITFNIGGGCQPYAIGLGIPPKSPFPTGTLPFGGVEEGGRMFFTMMGSDIRQIYQ